MNKTSIKFYSGLDSIGGVVMEISYNNSRVFFEAGTEYNPAFDMFDSHVDKRPQFISDYLWLNELPMIDGIYREEDICNYNLIPANNINCEQAFFITHLHLDHMRMMGMIDPSVKVYLSKSAQIIESALEDVNLGVESIRGLSYDDIPDDVTIGDIHIHRFTLNDDSYQDLSFYIQTPDLSIHFTGDIFVYGKYFNNILNEIKYINNHGVDILIPEGTTFFNDIDYDLTSISPTFTPDNLLSKQEMNERIADRILEHDGLVVFNYYEREMSDVMDLMEYSKACKRQLVFEPESAHIINKFFNQKVSIMLPDTYKHQPKYLEEIIKNNDLIDADSIISNPDKYLVQNSYPNLLQLLDFRNLHVLYIHYSGIPLGQFDPAYKRLYMLLNKLNFEHCSRTKFADGKYFSSHACREQLLAYIQEVNAKLIVPCHSANREKYESCITKPYFHCLKNKRYIYNKELNTLEEIDDE